MPTMVTIMLATVGLLILSVFAGISGLPVEEYDKMARQRALSEYYQTGSVPASVVVLGRTVDVPAGSVSTSRRRDAELNILQWRKAMVEQALINVCLTALNKCGKKDISLLWSYMPASSGLVSDLLVGTSTSTIDCSTATSTEFAQYSRYLLSNAVSATLLAAVTFEGSSLNYYYSKPSTGEGCTYNDLVDLK